MRAHRIAATAAAVAYCDDPTGFADAAGSALTGLALRSGAAITGVPLTARGFAAPSPVISPVWP
ncbi:MAG: hypothetical protein WB806_02710, partial [Xanthobacteraceae bacterium]